MIYQTLLTNAFVVGYLPQRVRMHINIYAISKSPDIPYKDKFLKLSSSYATINEHHILNNTIKKAQATSKLSAQSAYDSHFTPKLPQATLNIALDENGKMLDSISFANMLKDISKINFFIGGAYGFGNEFISKCHKSISLSPLTFSKDLAYIVLCEQVYRALSILNNHPYHKS